MSDEIQVILNQEELKKLYYDFVKEAATKVVKEASNDESIKETIRKVLGRKYFDSSQTQLEEYVQEALGWQLRHAVGEGLKEAGINDLIKEFVKEFTSSEEFKINLKRRVEETVKTTTFYVRPEIEENDRNPNV